VLFLLLTLLYGAVGSRVDAYEIGSIHVYLSPEEGRQKIFPEALRFAREVRHLTPAAKDELERQLGRPFAEDSLEVYKAFAVDGGLLGYAIASEEIGKFRPISFIVGIDTGFAVRGAAVLIYRESRGGQVRQPRFLRQYFGKGLDDPIRINRDIVNISGATLSVRSLNFGVRRLLVLADYFYRPTQSAMH
jgi:hypothetical protein